MTHYTPALDIVHRGLWWTVAIHPHYPISRRVTVRAKSYSPRVQGRTEVEWRYDIPGVELADPMFPWVALDQLVSLPGLHPVPPSGT
jgi:hypothetical protein